MKKVLTVISWLALTAQAGWWVAKACAPDFLVAVFNYARHPDMPRTAFIDGHLGILQPTFARSYLVIAYRYLNGIGLDAREREQARDYYFDRRTGQWDNLGTDWEGEWEAARSRIKNPSPPQLFAITHGQLSYDPETHSFALNCAGDAYRIALHTLQDRRTRFGMGSAAFRSWLSAQDRVFSNCLGSGGSLPDPATSDLPLPIRKDRDYQIAAANFYAGNYKAALDQFRSIGGDANSPWNQTARYLVVRTLLRLTQDEKTKEAADADLRTESDAILADSQLKSIHGVTWNLVERANIRQRNQAYFHDLAELLASRGQDDGLREELWNYTDVYDGIIGPSDPNGFRYFPEDAPPADPARFRDADLSDWIYSFQSRRSSAYSHALMRWQQTRSPAWLLAALSHATAQEARDSGLLAAADRVERDSPAFLTARYLSLRDYEDLGRKPEARAALDVLLADTDVKTLPSSVNLLRGLRMLAAPDFHDFLDFAIRKPVLMTFDMNMGEAPDPYWEPRKPVSPGERIDRDAAFELNRNTPLLLLKEAALGKQLPSEVRAEALLTAFTRSLVLNVDASDLANALKEAQPGLEPLVNGYVGESTPEGRRFAAAFLLLHRPEARPYMESGVSRQTAPGRIDDYRDNWWCPVNIQLELDSIVGNRFFGLARKVAYPPAPDFLNGQSATEASDELSKLSAAGPATNFLGGIVLPYIDSHPDDPRIPEALHDLVVAGRLGCADAETWKTSRAAFRELQARYPKSAWAKRTPYWYTNSDLEETIEDRMRALKIQEARDAQ